jgi:hypothetical protein
MRYTAFVEKCLKSVPPPAEVRQRLCENLNELGMLKRLLKLAEETHRVREVRKRDENREDTPGD